MLGLLWHVLEGSLEWQIGMTDPSPRPPTPEFTIQPGSCQSFIEFPRLPGAV